MGPNLLADYVKVGQFNNGWAVAPCVWAIMPTPSFNKTITLQIKPLAKTITATPRVVLTVFGF